MPAKNSSTWPADTLSGINQIPIRGLLNTRAGGEPGLGTASANLDSLIGGDLQILFRVLNSSQASVISVDAY